LPTTKKRIQPSHQPVACPQAAGLIEELLHLRRHVSETSRRAKNDGVIVCEIVDLGDRRLLVELEVRLARDLLRHEFGTRLISTLAPAARAPSATASAMVSM